MTKYSRALWKEWATALLPSTLRQGWIGKWRDKNTHPPWGLGGCSLAKGIKCVTCKMKSSPRFPRVLNTIRHHKTNVNCSISSLVRVEDQYVVQSHLWIHFFLIRETYLKTILHWTHQHLFLVTFPYSNYSHILLNNSWWFCHEQSALTTMDLESYWLVVVQPS